MILTLAWKELREHQAVWLTMAFMTVLMSWGLGQIVALDNPAFAPAVSALTILGMSATYGVVCGAMMFAGEHEGGTLVFLDIFLGRRGLLWTGKFAIGVVLVLTQAIAVALTLYLLKQQPPDWAMRVLGNNDIRPTPLIWFLFLPVVSLEAYCFGLLGSSFTQRVLAGAAVAAAGVTPVWLFAIFSPPLVFFVLQLVIAFAALAISWVIFINQSREATAWSPQAILAGDGPALGHDAKDEFLKAWEEFEQGDDDHWQAEPLERIVRAPATVPTASPPPAHSEPVPYAPGSSRKKSAQAKSPSEVLLWLTLQQAWPVLWPLAIACLVMGLISPANTQVLWPLATLLLGVVCGVAAFAPEQRDLSYQFLAAQHFPLRTIWRFKLGFWLTVAVLGTLLLVVGHYVNVGLRRVPLGPSDGFGATVPRLLGPTLFFGIWLAFGFGAGQVVVWLCRKSILALLISFLAAAVALGLWLPSVLCGGMGGWQLWAAPLTMLLATGYLVRAWAGGQIYERKPIAALIGFGSATVVWALLNFGYRALEVPDVGPPLDPRAFRAAFPADNDKTAAKAIHQAAARIDDPNDAWLAPIAAAAELPIGILELPRADGSSQGLLHLAACRKITEELLRRSRTKEPESAFKDLAQILALSRNLRNKAPLESYLTGVRAEDAALEGLDPLLARGKRDPKLLHRILDGLNRHARETPPAIDCLHTECFRSKGVLANPSSWTLAAPGTVRRIPERWQADGIALSLDTPWEAERRTRIWQVVWAGLFRAVESPHWERPELPADPPTERSATGKVLRGWLPAPGKPDLTRAQVVRVVDSSWLADERLFCSIFPLREAATRARWRVDATRQIVALSLYRLDEKKAAKDLQDLVPKYLPGGLPIDPYSGQPYRYRAGPENAAVWSTGPDRVDHGGRNHGGQFPDDDPQWKRGDFDLLMTAP